MDKVLTLESFYLICAMVGLFAIFIAATGHFKSIYGGVAPMNTKNRIITGVVGIGLIAFGIFMLKISSNTLTFPPVGKEGGIIRDPTSRSWWNGLDKEWRQVFMDELKLDQEPTDSELEDIVKLPTINCSNTRVHDLVPLSRLTQLRDLVLDNTSVSNLDPLKNLENLNSLSIENTNVRDLSPLYNLSNLTYLNCIGTPVYNGQLQSIKRRFPHIEIVTDGKL